MTLYTYEIIIDQNDLDRLQSQIDELRDLSEGGEFLEGFPEMIDQIMQSTGIMPEVEMLRSFEEVQSSIESLRAMVVNMFSEVGISMDEEQMARFFSDLIREDFSQHFTKISQIHDAIDNIEQFVNQDMGIVEKTEYAQQQFPRDVEVLDRFAGLNIRAMLDEAMADLRSDLSIDNILRAMDIDTDFGDKLMNALVREAELGERRKEIQDRMRDLTRAVETNLERADEMERRMKLGDPIPPDVSARTPEGGEQLTGTPSEIVAKLNQIAEQQQLEAIKLREEEALIAEDLLDIADVKGGRVLSTYQKVMQTFTQRLLDTIEDQLTGEISPDLMEVTMQRMREAVEQSFGVSEEWDPTLDKEQMDRVVRLFKDMDWKGFGDMARDLIGWMAGKELGRDKAAALDLFMGRDMQEEQFNAIHRVISEAVQGVFGTGTISKILELFPEKREEIRDLNKAVGGDIQTLVDALIKGAGEITLPSEGEPAVDEYVLITRIDRLLRTRGEKMDDEIMELLTEASERLKKIERGETAEVVTLGTIKQSIDALTEEVRGLSGGTRFGTGGGGVG